MSPINVKFIGAGSQKSEVGRRKSDFGFIIPRSAITLTSDFQQISFKHSFPEEIYEKLA
jgi:hypothetical protein